MKTVMERKTFRDMMKVVTLVDFNGDLFSSVAFFFIFNTQFRHEK